MGRCRVPDCSGLTEYDENAQAIICTICGTVATQDILRHDWDGEFSGSSLYFGPTTLKSLRRVGGGLAGQSSKEDRDRRNTTAMHQYILGVLTKLAYSGLSPRTCILFDQARTRGKYRWGRKAVLVAGACIIVVLRESKKGIMISQLASLMDVSSHALCRVFTQICTLLSLRVPPFDPLSILPHLQSHITYLTTSPDSRLPTALLIMLQSLPPASVLRLASSLAILLNHLDCFSSPGPSSCQAACALFIVALEGQAGHSLPSYTVLAQALSAKAGVRKDLVIERYRDIYKVIEQWMADVPWLSAVDHPDNKLGAKRRKVSRRDVVASGIRDVVQFREDILRARKCRETEKPITVSLEVAENSDDSGSDSDGRVRRTGQKRRRLEEPSVSQSSRWLRFIHTRPVKPTVSKVDLASLSLLSPSHPFSSDPFSSEVSEDCSQSDVLQNQILTSSSFPADLKLSRLQQLAISRGGESEVGDDELFDQGELESFFRSEDEMNKIRDFLDQSDPSVGACQQGITSSSHALDWDLADFQTWEGIESDKDVDCHSGEQIIGEWREASPFSGYADEGDDHYDLCSEG